MDWLRQLERWAERSERRQRHRSDQIPARPPRNQRPRCGAKTRQGTPCQAPVVWIKGERKPKKRCRLHGGLSTGPKTPEGKARAAAAIGLQYDAAIDQYVKPRA
ncbi:MAG: HGGxSTG domain-containing protein [Myxococcota bacterium]